MEAKALDRLVARMQSVHDVSPTPYDREDIERLIRSHPELFNRFRRRASVSLYLTNRPITRAERLWIALNLTMSVERSPRCYFCDESFTQKDVFAGKVHLEHFRPRSMGGEHHPVNITLACDQCNRLKSNLEAEDFERMLNEPDHFFADRPRLRSLRRKLIAFAEISAPHYKGLSWIGERFNVPSTEWRRRWEDLRASYRRGRGDSE